MRARAVLRQTLRQFRAELPQSPAQPLLLVALSGGADSLALAAVVAAEAARCGFRAGAVVVDHQLQADSTAQAERAVAQAAALGLQPQISLRCRVGSHGGPEAAARKARYAAFAAAAAAEHAVAVLIAHTASDQAEQVLLALARGSGTRSIAAIPPRRTLSAGVELLRPFIAGARISRAETLAICAELGLEPWHDPHNSDCSFKRVRVRERVLPELVAQLGHGVVPGLVRSAELALEDANALDEWAAQLTPQVVAPGAAEITVSALAEVPAAIRQRIILRLCHAVSGVSPARSQILEVARLVTHWHGQGAIQLEKMRVLRRGAKLFFNAA